MYGTTTTSPCKHTAYEAKEIKTNRDQLVCKNIEYRARGDLEYGAREDLEYGAREDLENVLLKNTAALYVKIRTDGLSWITSIYQEKLSEMSQHRSVYQYYCGRSTVHE